jgi:hypothetical protein
MTLCFSRLMFNKDDSDEDERRRAWVESGGVARGYLGGIS